MKTTTKLILMATALMAATPAFAGDMKKKYDRKNYYNSQRPIDNENYVDNHPELYYRDADGVPHRKNMGRSERYDSTWMGMRSTTRGMKTGSDSDVNNRMENPYTYSGNLKDWRNTPMSRVVKH